MNFLDALFYRQNHTNAKRERMRANILYIHRGSFSSQKAKKKYHLEGKNQNQKTKIQSFRKISSRKVNQIEFSTAECNQVYKNFNQLNTNRKNYSFRVLIKIFVVCCWANQK